MILHILKLLNRIKIKLAFFSKASDQIWSHEYPINPPINILNLKLLYILLYYIIILYYCIILFF